MKSLTVELWGRSDGHAVLREKISGRLASDAAADAVADQIEGHLHAIAYPALESEDVAAHVVIRLAGESIKSTNTYALYGTPEREAEREELRRSVYAILAYYTQPDPSHAEFDEDWKEDRS